MIFQTSQPVPFVVAYTNAGAAATGLTVTYRINRLNVGGTWTLGVATGTATEGDSGMYGVTLGSGSTATAGVYVCYFTTAGTVDAPAARFAAEVVGNSVAAALPSVAPAASGGLPTVDASNNVHGLQTRTVSDASVISSLTTTTLWTEATSNNDFQASGSIGLALGNFLFSAAFTSGKINAYVAGADSTVNVSANVKLIAGQTASAAAGVAFPASIGTSTFSAGQQADLVSAPNATAIAAIQAGLSKPGTAQTITPADTIAATAAQTAIAAIAARSDAYALLSPLITGNAFTGAALVHAPAASVVSVPVTIDRPITVTPG